MADKDLVNEKYLREHSGLPTDPASDGTYLLQNVINSGTSTKGWNAPSFVKTVNITPLGPGANYISASDREKLVGGAFINSGDLKSLVGGGFQVLYYPIVYIDENYTGWVISGFAAGKSPSIRMVNLNNYNSSVGGYEFKTTNCMTMFNNVYLGTTGFELKRGELFGATYTIIDSSNENKLTALTLTESSGVYTSSEQMTTNKNIHVKVNITTANGMSSVGLDLSAYSTDVSYSVGRIKDGATMYDIVAYINSNRNVVIDTAAISGITSLSASYLQYN